MIYEVPPESKLPLFVAADNLSPFITNELHENPKAIRYKSVRGSTNIVYKAEALPSIN